MLAIVAFVLSLIRRLQALSLALALAGGFALALLFCVFSPLGGLPLPRVEKGGKTKPMLMLTPLAKKNAKKLFTLRASRKGRLEARGQEIGRSVSWKQLTPEFPEVQKPGTVRNEMAMEWNRTEWNGTTRNGKQWNDVEWNKVEWNEMG